MAVTFTKVGTTEYIAEGHTAVVADLDTAYRTKLEEAGMSSYAIDRHLEKTAYVKTWYHDKLGFTHDCSLHSEEEALPTCYQSREVIVAVDNYVGRDNQVLS